MLINFLIFFAMIRNKEGLMKLPYEIIYGLRITFNDHAFFGVQKAESKATCLAELPKL